MRCSSCEPLLDRYLEATLPPARMAHIAAHISSCAHCTALLEEVRVVDALLFTTRVPDLPENFTFAVMAETGSMPAPRARAHPVWSFLVLYPAAAWVGVIAYVAASGTPPAAILWAIGRMFAALTGTLATANASAAQTLSHASPGLAEFGFGVLALDAVLACIVAVLYFGLRPRLAAMISTPREVPK